MYSTATLRRPVRSLSPRFLQVVNRMAGLLDRYHESDDRPALFERLREELDAAREALPAADAPVHVVCWRERLHPHFLQAPFVSRALLKPFGYAGDYQLMGMIYRNVPEGRTPLGRTLHQFMNSWRGADAVRSRRRWILQRIEEHAGAARARYRIASMAAGPARELQDLIRESSLADSADLLAIDQDQSALSHARGELLRARQEAGRQTRLRFALDSVKQMLQSSSPACGHGLQDFVYSLGLFDYLPDPAARRFLTVLYSMTAPGGRLVVGNLAPHTDARFAIELICDWHLVYRSRKDLASLASGLPAQARVEIASEPTGMNLFLVVDRPA